MQNDPKTLPPVSPGVRPRSGYVYGSNQRQTHADFQWQRKQDLGRVHLAAMLDDAPIGDIVLKNIDHSSRCSTMGMQRVYADALLKIRAAGMCKKR
jgi:hypothetical protein